MKVIQGFYDMLIELFEIGLVCAWVFGFFPLSAKIDKKLKIDERKPVVQALWIIVCIAVWIAVGVLLAQLSLHEW